MVSLIHNLWALFFFFFNYSSSIILDPVYINPWNLFLRFHLIFLYHPPMRLCIVDFSFTLNLQISLLFNSRTAYRVRVRLNHMSTVRDDIGSHYTIGPCQDGEVFNILLSKQASNTTQFKRNFNLNKEYVSISNRKNQIQRYLRTNHLLEWFSNQYTKSTFQKICLTL